MRPRRLHRRALAVVVGVAALGPAIAGQILLGRASAPAPVFVQGTASTVSSALRLTNPVGKGDLIVAGITTNDGGTDPVTGVSDNLNGAWTKVTSLRFGNGHVDVYDVANSLAGSLTATVAGRGAITVAEYSGAAGATPVDQFAAAAKVGTPSAGPTPAIGGAGELVLGVGGMSAPGSFSAGTGFTLRESAVSNYAYANGLEDMPSTSPAGQSMAMGATSSGYAGGVVVVLRAAPPSGTPPTAALTVTPSSGNAPLPVTADASGSTMGSSPISTYTFDFGDGTVVGPQAGATANHTYNATGSFTVTVTVTDGASQTGTATKGVTVSGAGPTASLSVQPTSGQAPLQVTASDTGSTAGSSPISSYAFNFGDGSAVVTQTTAGSTTHTYSAAGTYTVTLTVTDSASRTGTATQGVTVSAAGTGPTAALTVTPSTGAVPLQVTADASGSTAGSSPISTYTFNFGDGSAVVGPQAGKTAQHTYSTVGSFTVTVTVKDTATLTSTATKTVAPVNPPSASLHVTPTGGNVPLPVTADASASTAGTRAIQSYTFDFGDGTTVGPQSTATASHTYTVSASYTVKVTVADTGGVSSTATASVAVNVAPQAVLSASPSSGLSPLAVAADASSSTAGSFPISTYTFNFGDGTTVGPQAGSGASHTYTTNGTFTLTLTVTDSHSNTATASATITTSSTVIVQDTFVRANQSGWGTASNGSVWTSGSGLSISGNRGLVASSGSSQFESLGSATSSDATGLVRFSVGASSNTAGIILRRQSSGDMDLGRYDGAGHVEVMYWHAGSWHVVNTTAFSVTPSSLYWLRFQAQGANLSIKAWPDGTSEPAAWTWSGSGNGVSGSGLMGLYGYAGSGTTDGFDSFGVTAIPTAPANSTITGTVTDSVSHAAVAGVTISTAPFTTTATTNASGAYSLQVPAGTYVVDAVAASTGHNENVATGVVAPANGSVAADIALAPIPAQTAMDAFTQLDHGSNWGTSTDGHVWADDQASYPSAHAGITNQQAFVDTTASTATDYDNWMGFQYQDMEVSVDLDMTTVLADPSFQHGGRLLARVQGATTWVLFTLDPSAGDLTLWSVSNNNFTQLATVPMTISTGQWYSAKLDVIGTLVQAKAWPSGTAEPGWQISATQTAVTGTGQAGLRTTGAFVDYRNFQQVPITRITGKVTSSATGNPISGATVSAGGSITTTTDAQGNYALTVPTGGTAYTVTASASGFTSKSASVTPPAGAPSTQNFAL